MPDDKSHFLYFEIEISYSPTERDRIGYDGIYVKAVRQLMSHPSAATLEQAGSICLKSYSSHRANSSGENEERVTAADAARSLTHKRPEPDTIPPSERPISERYAARDTYGDYVAQE